ncbi:glycine cleavage system aminomethyltransferase GcvT [Methylocella sp. CPCC 101449]|jgi:aminomethyltransferase|uniref:glycine cleavage system aminomethyltransferase GcvT n=1 Tax=Methylocella sp. CPCC 101449 TaxID=2987531 RepID=UPI00288CA857|nr:glycine cleavage system aminomethyltransferase GcvT [Methylocella sp. CPCC 101449]MDT2020242.1 glycine cleavage system aminomethyltransferase GcvT [Methylocella sp. CPCC 101449]HEV2574818.1 glycine cleavage system aminomethyltransferase GcvT [Beijerinckiaceae bacterium]
MSTDVRHTPLHGLHQALGARMAAFAGYDMPIQYPTGILTEHNWTRSSAGLFDVSHMGQAFLAGPDHATTAAALETLCPADVQGLTPGRQRYSQFLNADGGILDDFMVARPLGADGTLALVVNAGRKDDDYAHLESALPKSVRLVKRDDRALLALQGPLAADVVTSLGGAIADMAFMSVQPITLGGIACEASRSGYTGEDGFEISVPAERAADLWTLLSTDARVKPIGLGARDSLRLEAGLCLYGHDIDETTSPIEAALTWSIAKRRREQGGFPGAARIQREIAEGPRRKRVGLTLEGRQPVREGAEINTQGSATGIVTSGTFSPSLNRPIAMGYVGAGQAANGTALDIVVRGKALPAQTAAMPFVPHRYKR